MARYLVNYLLAGFLLVFSIGCSKESGSETTTPAVVVTPVVKQAVTVSSEFVGKTTAVEQVELRARVVGFLEKTAFSAGQFVKAGDILFEIEKPPYQVEVDRAKAGKSKAQADLALAQVSLLRMEELKKKQTVSQSDLDKAVADEQAAVAFVQAADAEIQKAELDLSYTTIRSPIEGQIDRAAFDEGNLVGPESGVLATVNKMNPIYVNFQVSEVAFTNFKKLLAEQNEHTVGLEGSNSWFVPTILLPNGMPYEFEGKFNFIDNKVDPSTGTILIRCTFPNPNKLLVPGQYVKVIIKLKEDEEALLIPQESVISQQAGQSVLVVDKQGMVSNRKIVLGDKHKALWVVKEGLKEGEWVISKGVQKVRPGMKVDAYVSKDEPMMETISSDEDKENEQTKPELPINNTASDDAQTELTSTPKEPSEDD